MKEMLSVSELSSLADIPESTVRRYLKKFEAYFICDSRGKGKKYQSDAVKVLKRIAILYNEGYQADEIEPVLSTQFPITINESTDITTKQSHKTIEQQFDEFKIQQAEFNSKLLKQLEQQQEYIRALLEEKRELDVLERSNKNIEADPEATVSEIKRWWKFWK